MLTLTCGVIETTASRSCPGRQPARAGGASAGAVRGGQRAPAHEDIEVPPWRYFQYEYTVRLLGDGFFGQDVAIPDAMSPIAYNMPAPARRRGREQTYVLPPLPMRIVSLVPRKATDIRDASRRHVRGHRGATLSRPRRSSWPPASCFAFAAVLLVVAARARLAAIRGKRRPVARAPVPCPDA